MSQPIATPSQAISLTPLQSMLLHLPNRDSGGIYIVRFSMRLAIGPGLSQLPKWAGRFKRIIRFLFRET